jgi:hypothetical protein
MPSAGFPSTKWKLGDICLQQHALRILYLHLAEKVFYNCILRDQPELKKTSMAFKSHTKLQYCKQHY